MNQLCKRPKIDEPLEIVLDVWTNDSSDFDMNNNFFISQNSQASSNKSNDDSSETLQLDKLNNYVLFEIFHFLSIKDIQSIKQISKRFYFLVHSYYPQINQVMIFVNERRFDSCVEHRQTELNTICSIQNFTKFSDYFLIKLNRLKVLTLCFLTINEQDLIKLTNLPCVGDTLVHLEISRCQFRNFYLTAQMTYEGFFEKLGPKLEHLIFYKNSSYLVPVNSLLKSINKYLIGLRTLVLDLKQYEQFNSSSEYLKNCTNLRHLDLHGYYCTINASIDRFIVKLIDNNRIQYLNLKCLKMKQNNLFYTIHNCPNLKVLKFPYDFADDNRYGRTLITNSDVFHLPYFNRCLQELRQKGTIVTQFSLASAIASLKYLEELHLTEIYSGDVNIDPLILYLYHYYKRNKIRKLIISNYEIHFMNIKAFCYVTKNLEALCLNELNECCYSEHPYRLNSKLKRTVNENFTKTIGWLNNLSKLSLNHCRFSYYVLELLLAECQSKVTDFSFLHCEDFRDTDCIDLFIIYADQHSDRQITVKLDESLVEEIENKNGPLFNICPSNLNIIPV